MATLICDAPPAPCLHVVRELATTAWLVGETVKSPGWLIFQDDVLMHCDHSGHAVFEVRLSDITGLDFPWWRFGQVCRVRVFGETFQFRFTPPHGGTLAVRMRGLFHPAIHQLSLGGDYAAPRAVAAAWRAVLRRS